MLSQNAGKKSQNAGKYSKKTGFPVEDGDSILKVMRGVSRPEIELRVGMAIGFPLVYKFPTPNKRSLHTESLNIFVCSGFLRV